jgi:hypothetical protein
VGQELKYGPLPDAGQLVARLVSVPSPILSNALSKEAFFAALPQIAQARKDFSKRYSSRVLGLVLAFAFFT